MFIDMPLPEPPPMEHVLSLLSSVPATLTRVPGGPEDGVMIIPTLLLGIAYVVDPMSPAATPVPVIV